MTEKVDKLVGKTILITRTSGRAGELSELLKRQGARVVELPVIEILPPESWEELDRALTSIQDYHWVVFSSVHAVESVSERLDQLEQPVSVLSTCRLAAIGPATARALEERGLKVDCLPQKAVAEGLVEEIARKGRLEGRRVLLPQANIARETLYEGLKRNGAVVNRVVAYRTERAEVDASEVRKLLEQERIAWITVTSPSSVRSLLDLLQLPHGFWNDSSVRFASIGPTTSGTLRALGLVVTVESKVPSVESLVDAIVGYGG